MGLFDESVSKQLKDILTQMQDRVKIVLFTQEIECSYCKEAHQFAEEIASLDERLSLTIYKLVDDKAMAARYQVDKVPAFLLLDKDGQDKRVRFYGIPAGYEINSFMWSILAVSGQHETIPKEISERIARIDKPIHLQVFVSMTCPNCPDAVLAASFLAMENPNIRADMIESAMFVPLAIRYNVSGVPKTVVNDKAEFIGALPIPLMLDILEKPEVNPG